MLVLGSGTSKLKSSDREVFVGKQKEKGKEKEKRLSWREKATQRCERRREVG